jgi:hypothetical protein
MDAAERMQLACVLACWAALWAGLPGCDRSVGRRQQLASANPLDRAQAAVGTSEAGDLVAVHKLVDLLEDPDDAVRMYAMLALRRLCGEDFGYRYYESAPARAAAVQRWRQALRSGQVVVRPTSQPLTGRGPVKGQPAESGAGGAMADDDRQDRPPTEPFSEPAADRPQNSPPW